MSQENQDAPLLHYHGSYKSYIWGFVLSLLLTFVAYFAVVKDFFSFEYLVTFIIVLFLNKDDFLCAENLPSVETFSYMLSCFFSHPNLFC